MKYSLKLMTDKRIKEIASGEIKNYGYFNFKFKHPKPVPDGLFCQKVFGPTRSYTCDCGITRKISGTTKFKSTPCSECGIEYISSDSRNDRFGYINTGIYYINPICVKLISRILGIGPKLLESLSRGDTKVSLNVSPNGYLYDSFGTPYVISLDTEFGDINSIDSLVLKMKELDIDGNISMMENKSSSGSIYYKKGYSLYDFFNQYVIVSPPSSRDMKKVSDDRIGYGEVNILYSRIIRDSIRVRVLEQEDDSVVDISHKKEIRNFSSLMIQKLMYMLITDGCSYGKVEVPARFEIFKGKEGLIRGNLLGKRVDFSGRSVITAGPDLPLDCIGIPFDMIYELAKPHIIGEIKVFLIENNSVSPTMAIKDALWHYSKKTELSKEICESVSKTLIITMNRAPTLHRYGVMDFKVKIHWDKCIYFPIMACTPFNADFDGDTLGAYLKLSDNAMSEYNIMSFTNNLMNSKDYDEPLAMPNHEGIVGAYLLSHI